MAKAPRVDNTEFIPFALHELGGSGEFFDVEDIFLHCYKIAPERFRWRKYDLPNYKTLSKALRDFEGSHPSLLVKTADGLSRQLSAEGNAWVRSKLPLFERVLRKPGANPPTRRRDQRLLNEFADSSLVQTFLQGGQPELVRHEVADVLLCAPDSPASVWRERLQTYRSAADAARRSDLVEFLDYVHRKRPEWFGEAKR
jgi:hypothetical protein